MLPEETINRMRKLKPKRILLQAPEGLKTRLQEIAGELMSILGVDVIISCEPCYGACDVADCEAERLGCDLVLHIGHSELIPKTKIPVIYEEYEMGFDVAKLLEKNTGALEKYNTISLLTTMQYAHKIKDVKKFLEGNGIAVALGLPKKAKHPGQLLGCDPSAAQSVDGRVDAHLFFGSGLFHPLGLAGKVKKPILFLNLESGKIEDLTKEAERLERIRRMKAAEAKDCINFGIVISTKQGQMNIEAAESVKKMLERMGKKAWILAMNEISQEKLLGLKLECIVNTACPRISEDSKRLGKLVINVEDAYRL